jgi:hypothetical protein
LCLHFTGFASPLTAIGVDEPVEDRLDAAEPCGFGEKAGFSFSAWINRWRFRQRQNGHCGRFGDWPAALNPRAGARFSAGRITEKSLHLNQPNKMSG